jgi:hypothetical protein
VSTDIETSANLLLELGKLGAAAVLKKLNGQGAFNGRAEYGEDQMSRLLARINFLQL